MIRGRRDGQQGIVLIVTLWVLTVLAILAVTFAATMHVEARAAANEVQRTRARYAAKAGIQRAILAISQDTTGYASPLSEWASLSSDSSDEQFPFPDDEAYEVAVTDECGKINVNAADETLLGYLPELTTEAIDSILDWRDSDDDPRPDGAEIDYYSRLKPPRACANRDLYTLPELLLVRSVTKEAYYGQEAAAIGRVRTNAQASDASNEDTATPLEDLLTVYGGASDTDAQGQARLNINTATAEELAEATGGTLAESDAQAIVDLRDRQGSFRSIGDLLRVPGMTREKMRELADLLTTRSQSSSTTGQGGATGGTETTVPSLPGLELPSQIGEGGLPTLPSTEPSTEPSTGAQAADTSSLPQADTYQPNIYNLNTAPAEVLSSLDGMTEELLEAIIEYRESEPFASRGDLLALKEVTDDVFSRIVEKVTVRSSTLKITSIGSVEEGRVQVRITAILSLQESEPTIVYLGEG